MHLLINEIEQLGIITMYSRQSFSPTQSNLTSYNGPIWEILTTTPWKSNTRLSSSRPLLLNLFHFLVPPPWCSGPLVKGDFSSLSSPRFWQRPHKTATHEEMFFFNSIEPHYTRPIRPTMRPLLWMIAWIIIWMIAWMLEWKCESFYDDMIHNMASSSFNFLKKCWFSLNLDRWTDRPTYYGFWWPSLRLSIIC